MPSPSVTYTFANSTTADATQVNQNFTDLINGATDGTKTYSIAALTVAGATSLNGAVTLGASGSNDLTFNGSVASNIAFKTTFTYDFGSATVGAKSLYLGASDATAHSVRLIGGAIASSYTFTFPTALCSTAKFVVESDASGNHSYSSRTDLNVVSKTTTYIATRADDVILCSGSAFTVTLPAASGSMKKFIIKKTDSSLTNIITIARAGSDTIDGATSTTLNTQYEAITIVSDGASSWSVIARDYPRAFVAYTPTFTGFGTAASITAYSRRVADAVEGYIKFTTGTCTGVTAQVSLGFNGSDSNVTADSTKAPSAIIVGYLTRDLADVTIAEYTILSAGANTYLNFGRRTGTETPFNTINGSTFNNSQVLYLHYVIPISGWKG